MHKNLRLHLLLLAVTLFHVGRQIGQQLIASPVSTESPLMISVCLLARHTQQLRGILNFCSVLTSVWLWGSLYFLCIYMACRPLCVRSCEDVCALYRSCDESWSSALCLRVFWLRGSLYVCIFMAWKPICVTKAVSSFFRTVAHRSVPGHSTFGPLRSLFRSAHMLFLWQTDTDR